MARAISKSKKRKIKEKRNKEKIKKMERQDQLGISRKKINHTMEPKIFFILKGISIVLIPVLYFLYSPLLIVGVIFSICMMVFATMTERKLNHTFIKSNHIKIPKIDSILAVLVLLLALVGGLMSTGSKKKMPKGNIGMEIVHNLQNVGSCLTGNRSVIKNIGMGMHFGTKDFPDDMPSMPEGKPPRGEMSLEDLPLEAVFSQMISSISTVMVFLIPGTSAITMIVFYKRKNKFQQDMDEVISGELLELNDEVLDTIFMFGYEKIEEDSEKTNV